MSNGARERIFANLRSALEQGGTSFPETGALPRMALGREEKVVRLKQLMEAVHTEVHITPAEGWIEKLKEILIKRQSNTLLYAPETKIGEALERAWQDGLPPLTAYGDTVEEFKETLFGIDAGITSTRGGIAESGALILWPDEKEPRLMSLVPSVHIAVLEADRIYNTFAEAMEEERWQDAMPTNALLISGPSKTADIELTLTFGVHGPKELIVLILKD
jgi:L-lactate dehydrogenase complex protein LldG